MHERITNTHEERRTRESKIKIQRQRRRKAQTRLTTTTKTPPTNSQTNRRLNGCCGRYAKLGRVANAASSEMAVRASRRNGATVACAKGRECVASSVCAFRRIHAQLVEPKHGQFAAAAAVHRSRVDARCRRVRRLAVRCSATRAPDAERFSVLLMENVCVCRCVPAIDSCRRFGSCFVCVGLKSMFLFGWMQCRTLTGTVFAIRSIFRPAERTRTIWSVRFAICLVACVVLLERILRMNALPEFKMLKKFVCIGSVRRNRSKKQLVFRTYAHRNNIAEYAYRCSSRGSVGDNHDDDGGGIITTAEWKVRVITIYLLLFSFVSLWRLRSPLRLSLCRLHWNLWFACASNHFGWFNFGIPFYPSILSPTLRDSHYASQTFRRRISFG